MSESLHTFCAWAARFRAYCELEDGPDSMSLTKDEVTLVVSDRKATLHTPAGSGEIDIDAQRWMVATPSSSKQRSNTVRQGENEDA